MDYMFFKKKYVNIFFIEENYLFEKGKVIRWINNFNLL